MGIVSKLPYFMWKQAVYVLFNSLFNKVVFSLVNKVVFQVLQSDFIYFYFVSLRGVRERRENIGMQKGQN